MSQRKGSKAFRSHRWGSAIRLSATVTSSNQTPEPVESSSRGASPGKPRAKLFAGIGIGAVVLVAGGAYGVGYAMAGDDLPRNASVSGVPVGGMTADQAVQTLETELAEQAAAELDAKIEGLEGKDSTIAIDPQEFGLSIDYPATVEQSGAGRSANPAHIWRVLTGGRDHQPVVRTNDAKLSEAVAAVARKHDGGAKNAGVGFTTKGKKPEVKITKAANGITLDQPGAVEAITEAYPGPTEEPLALPAEVATPEIGDDSAEKAAKDIAKPAISDDVTVDTGGGAGKFKVSEAAIAKALSFEARDGELATKLDSKDLYKASKRAIKDLEISKPRDARWKISGGEPKLVKAINGTEVKAEDLAKAVEPALTKSGKGRTVDIKLAGSDAKFSTADAEKAKVTEVTGKFTTNYPYANYRNVNLAQIAKRVNNTFLKPGETFSLNQVAGERNSANGYVDGYVIQGGVLKKESGGGVSQAATTLYNAGFFAGLEDVEHHPHTLYFDRYPAGREATVYYGSLDLRFKNDTPYGAVITASTKAASPGGEGSITAKIWSTKVYDKVTSSKLVKSNFTSGRTLTKSGPKCEYQAPIKGFNVSYSRLFYKDGKRVKKQDYSWRYNPGDEIKCTT